MSGQPPGIPRPRGPRGWVASGDPWLWLTGGAVSVSVVLVLGLLLLIAIRGLGHFWPADVAEIRYQPPGAGQVQVVVGEIRDREEVSVRRLQEAGVALDEEAAYTTRLQVKTGNRDLLGLDFRWLVEDFVAGVAYPPELVTVERREWGNLYGRLLAVEEAGREVAAGEAAWEALGPRLERALELHGAIEAIEGGDMAAINRGLEALRLEARRLELRGIPAAEAEARLAAERAALDARFAELQGRLAELYEAIGRDTARFVTMGGREAAVPLAEIVRAYRANALGVGDKLALYGERFWEFVSDEPREANTEGGIFPAIFGTVLMVLVMSVLVTPFGVLAAVYLREYARQGPLVRVIRIAVNNLAGVPSIVYGVFGLGFFVYAVGGTLDRIFFPEALPAPTFGTGGIFWASLTLALLTLPVVIVATEEGLARIPRNLREGSMALGATRAETLRRVILPMATPAMLTGLILAVARAAGEVAPLMLVGVVKLAPSLPVDGEPPFLHLERKFMHLGFHIYDVGFQSPNVEAARPLVYATAMLLVAIIVVLNLSAVALRNRLRERYRGLEG